MELTYYGHACFGIKTDTVELLFDPFITGNPLAKHIDISGIKAQYILLSHGHADHIADAIAIARANDATIISNFEVCTWINAQGYAKTVGMNIGGNFQGKGFHMKCVTAIHSSALPDGSYGGNPLGFVVSAAGKQFYYSGDTALTLDMKLIPAYWAKLNFAVLPIGDHFTMNIDDAIIAASLLDCTTIVGVHYDSFAPIKINHEETFRKAVAAGLHLLLPVIGTTIEM